MSDWKEVYYGSWQFPWALALVPAVCALLLQIHVRRRPINRPRSALDPVMLAWLQLVAVESLCDALATTKALSRALGPRLNLIVSVLFVIVGDTRAYFLVTRFRSATQTTKRALIEAFLIVFAVLMIDLTAKLLDAPE